MMKRLVVVVALVACKDKSIDKVSTAETVATTPGPKIDGPSVTPIVTSSIAFAFPKDAPWWGEMSFSCYAAAIRLQPGNDPSSAFTAISPMVAPALDAADIDLNHDLAAVGVWGCGDGACAYIALTLRHPDRLKNMLAKLVPGATPNQVGKDHFTVESPGAQGPRTLHLQAVPIAWPKEVPADRWSTDAARATHVVFITGLYGKSTEIDPLAALADPATAAARIKDAEGVVSDAHGRCVVGVVGKHDFQPGYGLTRARFALAAPETGGDPLTNLMGSRRSLEFAVELALDPAPTEAVFGKWNAQARAWLRETMAPVRAQFAAQGPVVDVMFDLAALLGDRGFKHEIKGNALAMSWRTDRVPTSDLAALETRMQAAMKAAGLPTP
jgi:hypothetical protein